MSVRKVQLRRGTGAENNAFIGAVGEITVNTTNNSIRVHDGLTLGGSETAKANLANVLPTQNLNLNEYKIINVADPNDPQDVATKNYVDTHGGGGGGATNLVDLNDVNISLPANGNLLTYNNGTWENHALIGDATLSATGTLTLNAINNAKLVNSTINIGASPISLGGTVNLTGGLQITGSTLSVGNVATASKLFTAVTLGLGGSVITGAVSFDGSQSVEIIADVTPLSITNGMIANATITNAKLEHDFISFNSHEVHLGEGVTINGTDGEISVLHNAGVYTIGLAGTIVATSAVALAKTINLAGDATGSVNLDNANSAVTLNVTLGTITNVMLEHDYISVNNFQLHLSDNLDVVGADGVTINLDENTSIMTVGLGTINTNNLSSNFITFADNDSSENIALGGTLSFLGVANETSVFVLNGEVTVGLSNDVEVQGNLTVNTDTTIVGDLYASNIIESSLNAGITLQDTTSINANLDVYNPTGALINGTTVYLYVKYGANSIANDEYFHIFKTNDNGSIRQVVPLTLLQDGGQDKLAVKAGGIYEYQAVAGDYTNAGNIPNASFVLDTEGGSYQYQIHCYTSNDDGTEFEVAFSLNNANPAPTYSILFTSNDGSAYDRTYLISYDSALNIEGNDPAISTFNQTEKALSVDSSSGDTEIKGVLTSYGLNVVDANGNTIVGTNANDVNVIIKGANGTQDSFNIYGGVNGSDSFLKAQPNDLGGDGVLYLDGSLKVWNTFNTNFNSFNVDRQANTTITGGDFIIENVASERSLKLTNATGILEAREITNFFGGTLTLSGNIVATTQAPGDNSTALATTEYVDTAVSNSSILSTNNTFTGTNDFQNDVLVSGANHTFEVTDGTNTVFLVNSNTGDTIITGATTLKDNLSVINYTGTLVDGTTVYLYVKYGADSLANGEYFHIFKTDDNGHTREVIPLTLLQDGGLDKLAIKAGDLHEYQAVAGAYTNAGNVPNASFILDTEGGTYTYQIRAFTSNDTGTEFEVAFSLNFANPAPTYTTLFTLNDGSAHDKEYLITYDSVLNIQGNLGVLSIYNQVSRILSANISTGDITIHQGALKVDEISALGTGSLLLSGDVATTTQSQGDNSTKLATTEYVQTAVSRYTCTDVVFVANVSTLTAPLAHITKDAYFLNNGGTSGSVNLFELTNNDFDGYVLAIFNIDNVTMTIDGFGGQTISGDTTKDIPAGGCLTIMARGTSWYIM